MSSTDQKISVTGFGRVSLAELEDIMAAHLLADRLNSHDQRSAHPDEM